MTGREKVTYHLKRMSAEQADVSLGATSEDMEDVRYFYSMAKKNEAGTLTVEEAEEVSEMFEGDSPVIIDTASGRWVEID